MIVISVANLKGGVGKSTTTMMLADTLALHHNKKVFIIDCDPQANSSQMLLSFPGLKNAKEAEKTITAWLESYVGRTISGKEIHNRKDASSTIAFEISGLSELKESSSGLGGQVSIWPSTPDLRFVEMAFDHKFF